MHRLCTCYYIDIPMIHEMAVQQDIAMANIDPDETGIIRSQSCCSPAAAVGQGNNEDS